MYKITDTNNIFRKSDGAFIPVTPDNIDYQQFVKDVYEQGTG
jgi:hypothetical protein